MLNSWCQWSPAFPSGRRVLNCPRLRTPSISSSTLRSASSKEPTRRRPIAGAQLRPKGRVEEKAPQLTNDGPVPRARDPQHLDLNGPPTVHAQRRQPHPIERIRAARRALSAAAEVERLGVDGGAEWHVPRAIEPRVERPCAAGDGEVPGREKACGQWRYPGRELVCVVPDQEASGGQKDVWIRVRVLAALGVGSAVGGFIVITLVGGLMGNWATILLLLLLLR